MRNGKIIAARFWPYFSSGMKLRAPVILGINPERYETIFIYLTKQSPSPNFFEQLGKKVFHISQRLEIPFFKRPFAFLKLASILKNEGVDILHCHMHKATVYGVIAGRLAKTPVILSHVHGIGRTRNLRRKLLNKFIFPRIDKILTVGEAVKKDILQNNSSLSPEKVFNIGNSIKYDYFTSGIIDKQIARSKFGISQNAFVFGAAGRLAHNKGHSYLIQAFVELKKNLPGAELFIAGDGDFKKTLEKQVFDAGHKDSVHFLGRIDNMPEFYSAIDIFVHPSTGSEGLPRAILEAMTCGVPVIASNVSGIPETLDNGRFGLLIPPRDAHALADAMLQAANMPQSQKDIILPAAKEYVKENFSHSVMIKRIEKVYDELAAEKIR